MGSPAWPGLWRGLSRCGRSPYTTPPPPSLFLPKVAEVPDASGLRHLAAQRHAISVMLAPSTNAEEWWKRRRRYHGASWVQAHAPSRFFSATPKEKADPSDLAVGDDAHGPGDKAMHNRFASAQPLALVEQGEADVRDDIPTDYSLIKPEDDDLTEVSKCYMLKTGADQIVPNKLSSFLKWAAEYGAREDVEIVYPLSSTISIVANWSGDGIISYVKMKIKQLEVNSSGKYYLSKNNEFLHDWVQEHVGDTVFEQKLVNPADETTKCCSENRMTSLIPQIIKIGFATIHLIHSFTADPDEVKRWQIRYLTKAAQAAGAFDSDFERGLICVELPPLLGLFGDACIRINEPDITYGKTMIKEVYAYLYLPLICRREMFPTLPSSYHVLPQMRRFFSRRKRKLLDEIILKAKNSGVLCLDGNRAQVESSLRKVIAQLRQFCYDHGERVDVSSIYGPGSEVYTPPGVGTFHLEVLHCNKSINFPISANKLYFRAFRCDRGMFVLKDEEDFICDAGFTVLDFTGSYTSTGLGGHSVGDTWVGVEALRHAFHVISKCNGRPSDLLKQAIKIFVIHIAEAARIQAVLNAVCESMSGARAYLDVEYPYALLEEWNTRKI